jgi:hypothetical protein
MGELRPDICISASVEISSKSIAADVSRVTFPREAGDARAILTAESRSTSNPDTKQNRAICLLRGRYLDWLVRILFIKNPILKVPTDRSFVM